MSKSPYGPRSDWQRESEESQESEGSATQAHGSPGKRTMFMHTDERRSGAPGRRTLTQFLPTAPRPLPSAERALDEAFSGGRSPLPYREQMERGFGIDLSNIRVQRGRGDLRESVGAHAAARGDSIAFADVDPDARTVAH